MIKAIESRQLHIARMIISTHPTILSVKSLKRCISRGLDALVDDILRGFLAVNPSKLVSGLSGVFKNLDKKEGMENVRRSVVGYIVLVRESLRETKLKGSEGGCFKWADTQLQEHFGGLYRDTELKRRRDDESDVSDEQEKKRIKRKGKRRITDEDSDAEYAE